MPLPTDAPDLNSRLKPLEEPRLRRSCSFGIADVQHAKRRRVGRRSPQLHERVQRRRIARRHALDHHPVLKRQHFERHVLQRRRAALSPSADRRPLKCPRKHPAQPPGRRGLEVVAGEARATVRREPSLPSRCRRGRHAIEHECSFDITQRNDCGSARKNTTTMSSGLSAGLNARFGIRSGEPLCCALSSASSLARNSVSACWRAKRPRHDSPSLSNVRQRSGSARS